MLAKNLQLPFQIYWFLRKISCNMCLVPLWNNRVTVQCHISKNTIIYYIINETNSETIIGPPKIFNAMTQVKINRLPGSYSICRWLSILVHFVFIMLYPFIYNDNDAYCLHGWWVFFMYILNSAFVANLNILLLMLIKRLTLTKPIPEAFFKWS